MTSHPDKLFRDGLGDYQKVAPPTAWDRIESSLDRKRTLSPWLKIAAGLLILIGASVILLDQTKDKQQMAKGREQRAESKEQSAQSSEQIVGNSSKHGLDLTLSTNIPQEGNKPEERNNHLPFRGREQRAESIEQRAKGREPRAKSRGQSAESSGQWTVGDQHSFVGDQALNNNNSTSDQNMEVVVSQENADSILSVSTASSQVEVPKDRSAPVVATQTERTNLTYSVEEVNSRFLKKESLADATPEKKNTSGIQKVVAVALDLRYEESLVGELREKKNEWLSINTSPKKRELNK